MRACVMVATGNAPPEVLELLTQLAGALAGRGFTLRLRAEDRHVAPAVIEHCAPAIERYHAWEHAGDTQHVVLDHVISEALGRAAAHVEHWELIAGAKQLKAARDVHMLLGPKLATPAKLLACYTPDKAIDPDTRTARSQDVGHLIALAHERGIPVLNLARVHHQRKAAQVIDAHALASPGP